MNLKNFRFIDHYDDTETDIVCETFDAAMLYWAHYYTFFSVEEVNLTNEFYKGIPVVEVIGFSAAPATLTVKVKDVKEHGHD